MLRRLFILLACLAAIAVAKTPRPLANVPIHTPDQKGISLKTYHGKTIVVVIFSLSCQDCVAVVRLMDDIQKEYAARGLQVVGVAGDGNAKYLLGNFVSRYRPTYPIGYLSEPELKKLADISPSEPHAMAPIVMFVDRWGTVREQFFGNSPIFKDAQRSLKGITSAMLSITPAAAPKAAAPRQ